MHPPDRERDTLLGRARRTAAVGANMTGLAARAGIERLFGGDDADRQIAQALRAALGATKGPLMKVAQMLSTIPDLLPPDYAQELANLQSNAPAMGAPFVRRRMRAELGEAWQDRFAEFSTNAVAAASLGQVHKARAPDGAALACKLQYPDMASAVESDIAQLTALLALVRRLGRVIDPSEIAVEVGERLREELDYRREAAHMRLYRAMLAGNADIVAPEPVEALSTSRLLTMTWLEGSPLAAFKTAPQAARDNIARLLFKAWWSPMCRYGVIHGDPHLGNYSFADDGARLNLLDFGCVRVFPAHFVEGVLLLRQALMDNDDEAAAHAYRIWGFATLSKAQMDALGLWARFIYGPLLEDRVRSVADGIRPGEYGRREAMAVKEHLLAHGPVRIPREFVFMDRAAIGLGAAFLHLGAELNFRAMFEAEISDFNVMRLAERQADALRRHGLAGPRHPPF